MYVSNKIKAHFPSARVQNSNPELLWNSSRMQWRVRVVEGRTNHLWLVAGFHLTISTLLKVFVLFSSSSRTWSDEGSAHKSSIKVQAYSKFTAYVPVSIG